MRTIWNPTRELLQLHARLGRALGDPLARRWGPRGPRQRTMPPLDFCESADSFVIQIDLPGLSKDDVEVKVADGYLEIAGEVPQRPLDEARARRGERFSGSFRRLVPLPRQAGSEGVKAHLADGVLTLTVARNVPDGGRRIEIA